MATKMAATCQIPLVDAITWSFVTRLLPNFILYVLLLSISPAKLKKGFCLMKANTDGHLSDFTYALQLLTIHWTKSDFKLGQEIDLSISCPSLKLDFINLLTKFEIRFYQILAQV